jgi:hypothetical protein
MRNQLNYIIFGLINQPQVWIKHMGEELTAVINYFIVGVINQPQFRIQQIGENMDTDIISPNKTEDPKVNVQVQGGQSGMVYGLGVIGACIFYMSRAITLKDKGIGFLKGLVWPVFLVKEVLEFLHKGE